jgi:hypothetical protein
MNTSNAFRPNFLLDFANGEVYFGAGGVHLAANGADTSIEVKNGNNSVKLTRAGILTCLGNTRFGISEAGMSLDIMETGTQVSVSTPIQVKKDGSGSLANGGITWDSDGNLTLESSFEQNVSQLDSQGMYGYLNLPDIPEGYGKTILFVTPVYTRSYMGHRITMATSGDRLTHREMPETYRGDASIKTTIEGTSGVVNLTNSSAYICYGVKNTGSSHNTWVLNQLMNYGTIG